ncbi:MAG: TlpA family protein disulfide reductase [Planctomycetes bacterium]|nr:TlpA family protein disulfide reductase [Planctomycetota bacterium]
MLKIRSSIVLLSIIFISAGAGLASDVTGVSFGARWGGPPVPARLEGRVVIVEQWGYNCGPCRTSLPHMQELWENHREQGLVLVGAHSQQVPQEQVMQLCSEKGLTFTIVNGARVPGDTGNTIPQAFVYDHTGSIVFNGNPLDAKFGEAVETAFRNAPDFITGAGPFDSCRAEAQNIARRANLGRTLGDLEEKIEKARDDAERAEAEGLRDRLVEYSEELFAMALAFESENPTASLEVYNRIKTLFSRSEIGERADERIKELRDDEAFQNEVTAYSLVQQGMAIVGEIGPMPQGEQDRARFMQRRGAQLQSLNQIYQRLQRDCADTNSARRFQRAVSQYGIGQ